MKHGLVRADWDPEAGVWAAQSEAAPGLVTEAASIIPPDLFNDAEMEFAVALVASPQKRLESAD
jgi:hypothetical protein